MGLVERALASVVAGVPSAAAVLGGLAFQSLTHSQLQLPGWARPGLVRTHKSQQNAIVGGAKNTCSDLLGNGAAGTSFSGMGAAGDMAGCAPGLAASGAFPQHSLASLSPRQSLPAGPPAFMGAKVAVGTDKLLDHEEKEYEAASFTLIPGPDGRQQSQIPDLPPPPKHRTNRGA